MATSRHLEKVLAHAEDQLAVAGKQRPTEVLPTYKKFLKLEEHRLRLKHQAGGGGREICARRRETGGLILRHVFSAPTDAAGQSENSLAVVPSWGDGRGERRAIYVATVVRVAVDAAGEST